MTRQEKYQKLKKMKCGISEVDLRAEYKSRYDSDYLEECTLEQLLDLMLNEQVFEISQWHIHNNIKIDK